MPLRRSRTLKTTPSPTSLRQRSSWLASCRFEPLAAAAILAGMSRAYFPLRSSVELFRDPTSPEPIARAKEAAVLFDELIFEDGLFEASLNPESSIQQYKSADLVTDEDRRAARVIPEGVAGFRLDVTIEGPDGQPIVLPSTSGKLIGHYAAEWMSGVTDELDRLGADWARKIVLADEDLDASGLAAAVAETASEFTEVGAPAYPEPMIASFAAGSLARDLVIAGRLDATVQVTSLFEPLLIAESGRIRRTHSGQAALGIVVPHVAGLRWETIMEFREHPGSREARARLREIEERAMTEDPADAVEFQQRVGQEVTNDLFAVIDDLEGSVGLDVARHAAGFALSLVPLASEIAAVGETAANAVRRRRTWRAALVKLRTAEPEP
jgi:hypothetical protein